MDAVCLVPGSFDPPTLGHRWIAEQAAKRYSSVYVVGFINEAKNYTFSEKERFELMELQFGDIPGVKLDFSRGMLVDYCREHGITVILKGIRNRTDELYELKMAEMNRSMYSGAETVLIRSPKRYKDISSTIVRKLLAEGGDVSPYLGDEVAKRARIFFETQDKEQ